jgi:hypothetical protein
MERFCSGCGLPLTGYFEDEAGKPLGEFELAKILSGYEQPILPDLAESVLRLGPAPIVQAELWNAETANTIAHFLQLVEVIGTSDWLKSNLSIGAASGSDRIHSFECPDLGQMYSVFLPIRQLYAQDKAFDHACKLYLKHVGDPRKHAWVKHAKRRFHSQLQSVMPGPFQAGNQTVKDLLDTVLYGAGLVHYHQSDAAAKQSFKRLLAQYPRELVIFRFIMCCRDIYGCALAAYQVLRQDFEHWTTTGLAHPPDLKFLRGLFSSFPKPSRSPITINSNDDAPKGRVILSRVFAVHLPDGNVQLTVEAPSDDSLRAMPIDFLGPDRVTLPAASMTPSEFDRWTWELTTIEGYAQRFASRSIDSAPFEILRLGPSISETHLNAELAWWGSGNARNLVVSVANSGNLDVPQLHVDWIWHTNGETTDVSLGEPKRAVGRFQLSCADGGFNGTLLVGKTVMYHCSPQYLAAMRHHVVALAEHQYRLSICSVDQEVFSLDNAIVAQFIAE